MAVVLVLAGGILGFVSGLFSLVVLKLGILVSLGIWSGVGLLFVLASIGMMLLPRPHIHRRTTKAA